LEQQGLPKAENVLLESLSRFAEMHTSTTTKTLSALHRIFAGRRLLGEAAKVVSLAETNKLRITSGSSGVKRVAFVLDYSGSMSGFKIRTAVDNINNIVADHMKPQDWVMVIHFNETVHVDFELSPKEGNDEALRRAITGLVSPSGPTALYDAIFAAATRLTASHVKGVSDWIVALTDGEDNRSAGNVENLKSFLSNDVCNKANILMIGVGADVQLSILEPIAKSTEKGENPTADIRTRFLMRFV
jgi:Mg-chelatase subunit ChlD